MSSKLSESDFSSTADAAAATSVLLRHRLAVLHEWLCRALTAQHSDMLSASSSASSASSASAAATGKTKHENTDSGSIVNSARTVRELVVLWHAVTLDTTLHSKQLAQQVVCPVIDRYLECLQPLARSENAAAASARPGVTLNQQIVKDPTIAHNALLILLLIAANRPADSAERRLLVTHLADGIVAQQIPSSAASEVDGFFRTHFSDFAAQSCHDVVAAAQAILALSAAFELTRDDRFLHSALSAVSAYRSLFAGNKVDSQQIVFAIGWLSQAVCALHRLTANSAVKDDLFRFLLSMQSHLLDTHGIGFFRSLPAPPTIATTPTSEASLPPFSCCAHYVTIEVVVALEGLIDACRVLRDWKAPSSSSSSSSLPGSLRVFTGHGPNLPLARDDTATNGHTGGTPASFDVDMGEPAIDHNEADTPVPSVASSGGAASLEFVCTADSVRALADSMQRAITQAVEFLLQVQQMSPSSSGYGGFGSSLVDSTQRVDVAGHVSNAFCKLVQDGASLPRLRDLTMLSARTTNEDGSSVSRQVNTFSCTGQQLTA